MHSSSTLCWRRIATREAIDRTASSYSDLSCWIVLLGSDKRTGPERWVSSCLHTAVDDKVNTRDKGAHVGGEEQCGGRKFFGLAQPLIGIATAKFARTASRPSLV